MRALLLWCAVLLTVSGFYQPANDYVKTEVAEGITLNLPRSFVPVPENQLDQKYLSARKPIAAYTSADQRVDLGINTSNARWQADDLPMLQNFYRSSIMALYDEVNFLKEDIEKINGKDFAVFEFVSLVRPAENALANQRPIRKYTYIQYTLHNGKTYVFNFNCPTEQQSQWQETASTIMQSIRLK